MSYPFRFLSQRTMRAIRWADSVYKSFIKRGEVEDHKHTTHIMCGCDFSEKDPTCHFTTDHGKYVEPKTPPPPPQPRKKF